MDRKSKEAVSEYGDATRYICIVDNSINEQSESQCALHITKCIYCIDQVREANLICVCCWPETASSECLVLQWIWNLEGAAELLNRPSNLWNAFIWTFRCLRDIIVGVSELRTTECVESTREKLFEYRIKECGMQKGAFNALGNSLCLGWNLLAISKALLFGYFGLCNRRVFCLLSAIFALL